MKYLFWTSWSLAVLVELGLVFFFVWGLSDGTVSSFNIALWAGLLLGTSCVTGGSLLLKLKNHVGLATLVAMLLAVPALLAGLFLVIVLITNPRWN